MFSSYLWNADDPKLTIGYLCHGDPYEANAFEVLRSRWINDSKKLYGDFIPAQGAKDLHKVNRGNLSEMVSYIKRRLLSDWSDINFIIGTNPEDYIELRFTLSSVDAPAGLKAYMGTLTDTDFQMIKYQLRKVTAFWGVKSGGSGRQRRNSLDRTSPSVRTDNESIMRSATDNGNNGEDYVYYMLAPPWARHKDPILYLQQF